MSNHTYYTPTGYEQMLVAAGWVTPETLDADYVDFICKNGTDIDYAGWVSLKRQWDELDAAYRAEIDPLIQRSGYELSYLEEERSKTLLREMNWIEVLLGY